MWTFYLFLFETGSSGWLSTHYLAKDALGLLILLPLPPKCWDFSPGSLRLFCANRCAPQCPVYVALGWDPVLWKARYQLNYSPRPSRLKLFLGVSPDPAQCLTHPTAEVHPQTLWICF